MKSNNIFDIERRINLKEEYEDILLEYHSTELKTKNLGYIKVWELMEKVIKDWPYREATSSIESYLSKKKIKPNDDTGILLSIELWYNLLKWAPYHDGNVSDEFSDFLRSTVDTTRYTENLEYILENCNYRVLKREKKSPPQYVFSKRDVDVDIAISTAPEMADVLLGYLDIRNRDSIEYKRESLRTIAGYLEERKKDFKNTPYNGLYDSLSFAFNRFEIRHNDDNQIKLSETEMIEVYDTVFKIAVHIIQREKINEYKDFIDRYK